MLIELRVLLGPNADIPAPAIRVTLAGPIEDGVDLCAAVERIATAAGAHAGPAVRRDGSDGTVVVAFPWLHEGTGEALGEALVELLRIGPDVPLDERIARVADSVRRAEPGDPPRLVDPAVPTVAVTGTNGKTTTTRLLGRMAAEAGLTAAWSTTDGVFVAGRCVEPGDWSGPGGARMVLAEPGVGFAVLETARGGLMLRGMGVSAVDVAVFTNVSPDHLGLQGIDTVEMLAWAKSTVVKVVRPGGWAVLNAEDPLVSRYHDAGPGRPWFFALDPDGAGGELARGLGAPLTTVRSGQVVVEGHPDGPIVLGPVSDIPVTIAGLSRENTANALAAACAGLAAGLPRAAVAGGLRAFLPDATTSPGRMNIWSVPTADGGSATVILDFAHNEAGAEALFRVATGLRRPGSAVHASIGNAGDRTDAGITEVGRLAAEAADTVQLAAKSHYLRGRSQTEIDALQRAGIRSAGKEPFEEVPDEPTGLRALVARAHDGDVLAMMIHQDREACVGLLGSLGATADDPATVRTKAQAARPA
ncbi:MAG: Mur ligase family protein [Candidatus Nanopelagicales bacterium]|jgi:cyanophycin synthetase|nr:Mur ligase family protein [Candidatus Nanopelagicales bacterium]